MAAIKHIESVVKIYFTRDYGQFKFMKGNRDIIESKVKKICKAIELGIDVLKYSPIIVNKEMEIIDGQHRFAVSKMLKTNVFYVIMEDAELAIVPTINSNSSKWNLKDFLHSYIDLKKQAYIDLNEFLKQFPKARASSVMDIFHSGSTQSKGVKEDFRDGLFRSDHKELAYDLSNLLKDFEPYTENPYSRRFYTAMKILRNNGKYNHEFVVKKLEESGKRIEAIESPKMIINELELAANHKAKNRVVIH